MLDALANNPLLQLVLLGAAITAAVWASNHRERRQRAAQIVSGHGSPPARIAGAALSHSESRHPDVADGAWLVPLCQALHLLIIGHSQGGKTTLMHELARRHTAAGGPVIVCDPDAAPGLWPGCTVYGYANDLPAIDQALMRVREEVERRRILRGRGGQRVFPPLYLVIDEYQDVGRVGACPEARPLVEDILRRGGKLNIHLIVGVQDKQVKTMGLEGQGDLRRNFTAVVEVRADRAGQRWATVTDPTDAETAATYTVPRLADLNDLVTVASRSQPAPIHAAGLTPADAEEGAETRENRRENLRGMETDFPASASDFTISEVTFSIEEIAQIAAMIAQGGKGKTEVVQTMPGYSGRKHKAYAACYDRLRAAIDTLFNDDVSA